MINNCQYCTNKDEMYKLLNIDISDNNITVKMNKRRKNWFLELSEKNFDDLIIINYCPICGRKLDA